MGRKTDYKNGKPFIVSFRLTAEELIDLEEEAREKNTSVSGVVRERCFEE